MMQAVLSNASHPEYGVATIPFSIPREQFDHCIELVEALEIGNTSAQDCHVDEIRSAWPVLNRLEGKVVNLDEFYDYEKYGLQRMEQESGMFTDRGYISYHGTMSLEELMMEDPAEQYQKEQTFQMGGMSL